MVIIRVSSARHVLKTATMGMMWGKKPANRDRIAIVHF